MATKKEHSEEDRDVELTQNPERPREVEISFGMVYEAPPSLLGEVVRAVVVDLREENHFAVAAVGEEGGKLMIGRIPGTAYLKDIQTILPNKLSLEEIIDGIDQNYQLDGERIPESLVQKLTEWSKQAPRLLKE